MGRKILFVEEVLSVFLLNIIYILQNVYKDFSELFLENFTNSNETNLENSSEQNFISHSQDFYLGTKL